MPTTSSHNNKRKATTSELVKAAGYAEREAGKSKQRYQAVNKQQAADLAEYSNVMATLQAKLSAKAKDCRELAQLAQDRRREGNLAWQEADSRGRELAQLAKDRRREANLARQETDSRVAYAQSKARQLV